MRFGILGPTRVWRADGSEVPISGQRLRALLARLLLDAGQVVSADRLIDDLYGEQPPAQAGNALQSQVSRLRRLLPEAAPVELLPGGYRLAVDPETVDVHRFGRLAAAGRQALALAAADRAAELLQQARQLWRGPPLADVAGAPFAAAAAARLADLRLAVTEDWAEAQLMLGEPAGLLAELPAVIAEQPLQERLRGQLMRALAAAGRPAEALALFAQTREALAEQLGTDPSPELVRLHQALLRGEASSPEPSPAAGSPAASPAAGLPEPLTTFVGREDELTRLGKLLGESRLVSVTGPGGAGKTRLAIEAARRRGGEVRLVELGPVPTGDEVAQAVQGAFGLRDSGLRELPTSPGTEIRPSLVDRLAAALADRPVLLVLDSCEHVVGSAAALAARLLAACPRLRVLATSREPLAVTGEVLCPVTGLPTPPPDAPPESAGSYPATRLFLDRAAEVVPAEQLAPETVAQVCRTLDGLPLGIELAAAQLRALSLAEVAARLDDRFRLLTRGSRTAEPRHRTLQAAVAWSWELLTAPAQVLARRLTVFAGSASLAAVAEVAGATDQDTLPVLRELVDKSLVERVGDRYRMLETIRAYGVQRLAQAGELTELRAGHAGYFLELAQTADPHLRGAEQLVWLSQLDAERDNLHTALRWAIAARDYRTALELVSALSMYWWLRGLRAEAGVLAGELLAALDAAPGRGAEQPEEFLLCQLLAALGGGAVPPAAAARGGSADRLRALDRPVRQPFLYFLSAIAAGPPGDPSVDPEELAAQFQLTMGDDPWSRALHPFGVGVLHLWQGALAEAERHLATSLARFRALGERWGSMLVLASLAELAAGRGDPGAAEPVMEEALRLAGELDSIVDTSDLLRARADMRMATGEAGRASGDYRRALELASRAGAPELVAAARAGLAAVASAEGDRAAAQALAEQALAECPTGWFLAEAVRAGILAVLGRLAAAEGHPDQARRWLRRALTAPVPALAEAVAELVRLAMDADDLPQAARLLGAGAVLLRESGGGGWRIQELTRELSGRLGESGFQETYGPAAALPPERARELLTG